MFDIFSFVTFSFQKYFTDVKNNRKKKKQNQNYLKGALESDLGETVCITVFGQRAQGECPPASGAFFFI